MREGDLRGNDDLACHGCVQRISRYRGGGLAVVSKEIVVVEGAVHGALCIYRGVAAVVVPQHINGVILIAEGGIHHYTCLNILNSRARGLGHVVGDICHAVLIGVGTHEGDGLLKAQTVDRPRCLDGVVCALFYYDTLAGNALVAVITAEDVIFRHTAARDAEGGEGGVKVGIGIQQIFVVIGFGELIARLGTDVESAVGL